MASFTKQDYEELFELLRGVYQIGMDERKRKHYRVPQHLANRARILAMKVENAVGQIDALPASCWREVPLDKTPGEVVTMGEKE